MSTPDSTVLPGETISALQKALTAEHAAIWVYGLVSAFLPAATTTALNDGMIAHTATRDATERLLQSAGATPRTSDPAYITPQRVSDQASALDVLIVAESDASSAWRSVLEYTADQDVRKAALGALTDCAVRATRWRKTASQAAVTPALPGQS